jgi:hypothetical protein
MNEVRETSVGVVLGHGPDCDPPAVLPPTSFQERGTPAN